jgi:TolB-like protein
MRCVCQIAAFACLLLLGMRNIAYPAAGDSALHQDSGPTVAVLDFVGRGIDSNSAVGFSDRFRASLSGKARLSVLESGRMRAIRNGNNNQQSRACSDDSCLLEIGRSLGTGFIITGSIGRTDYIFIFNIKMIDVKTGKVVYSIIEDFEQPMPYVFEIIIPQLAGRFHDEIVRISFAALEIETRPEKVKVRLNNKEIGLTPLVAPDIEEGAYALRLSHENYVDLVDSLYLKKGDTTYTFFNLQPTDVYAKFLRDEKKKKNIRLLQGIAAFGSITAFSVGGYYESMLGDASGKQWLLDKYKNRRNIGYIAGAILAAGATVGFFF